MTADHVFEASTLLGGLDAATRAQLAAIWTEREAPAGAMIYAAEEPDDDMCFVLSGAAAATVFTARGRQITFQELLPGDGFGEFSAVDGGLRSATVVAATDCTYARLPGERFRQMLAEHPDLALSLIKRLVLKLRDLTRRVEETATLRADVRVRLEILRLAKRHRTGPDEAEIRRPPTQADLASWVMSNRESVAREMSVLRDEGLVLRRGRALLVPSIAKLGASIG